MRRFLLLTLTLILITAVGCSTIDVGLSKKANITKKMEKIAVFPFTIRGAQWGDEFADSITHQFFKTGKIEVVEREAIEKVLKEQKFSMTGFVDESKAVQIGKLLGADVIIIGRGTELQYRHPAKPGVMVPNLVDTFTLKAINVETGSLLITVRKEPGKAWDWRYRMKYCCSLTLIWNSEDITMESLRYDDISKQIVKRILEGIDEIEAAKRLQ